jgi:MtN3 and saliva related transmembrane protein
VHEAQVLCRHRSKTKRELVHRKGIIREERSARPMETVLATSAAAWGVLMAISPGLQIRKMLHHRSSREVSIFYFWVLLVGFALWIAYGLTIGNWFLIVPNAVAFTVCATTIAIALRFRLGSRGGGAFDAAT